MRRMFQKNRQLSKRKQGKYMAKCTDCNVDLIEGLGLYSQGVYLVELAKEKTLNGHTKAALEAAVCPKCGKVSFYLPEEQLAKLIDWFLWIIKGLYQTRKVRSGLIGPFYFIWELNSRSEITRQTLVGGENQFKSQSENPPKPPWRGKTFADNTRFPVKTILTGKYAMNAIPKLYNHAIKPKRTGLPQFLRQSRSAFPY